MIETDLSTRHQHGKVKPEDLVAVACAMGANLGRALIK